MSAQTDAHDPRAPVKAQGRRKTPTPPQRCWGGSDDAVSDSAPGSATATLRLKFGLPRDEFLRDAVTYTLVSL